ncbi:MAG: ABC transporter ATP-binding protein [Balneolaceae bacterium]|nr:ABC transporter ATP-binding protein [Balneolaceae bacterium]
MLEARNLTKVYEDGIKALDNLNLKVEPGKIFAMLGGNGAGKTTAINLFLDFIQPTEGMALINGINANKEPLEAKKHVAFVSENVQLYPNFTAMQNVDFFVRLGGKTHYSREQYEAALHRVGLQSSAFDKKLKDFSKGMRQKTGIAIAILKDAPAILLDEPTSGLDPKAGIEFIRLIGELRNEGKAILMSTHDIFRAKEISDHVGILNNGILMAEHSSDDLRGVDLENLYVEYMAGYMEHTESPIANALKPS